MPGTCWMPTAAALMALTTGAAAAGGSGVHAQLQQMAAASPQPDSAPPGVHDPSARYLFYDILEHEQLNKQRKGMMYAYTVAQSLGRQLVLHRLRVRKIEGQPQGSRPVYTHEFYPWRQFFNMSYMQGGVPVHEADQLLHALVSGAPGSDGAEFGFAFDTVLYANKLLEGVDRQNPRMEDSACPSPGQSGTSPFQWSKYDNSDAPWVGQLYDIAGLRARTVRCVDIFGSLLNALKPYESQTSIVLLNVHFQLGFAYGENSRNTNRLYWGVRDHLVFKRSLWSRAQRFVDDTFGAEPKFLAVHWRRGDFVFSRKKDVVKGPADAAPRIKSLMKEHGLTHVFLATGPDTTSADLLGLESALGLGEGVVIRYTPPKNKRTGKPTKMSPPTLAIIDQMLCVLGDVFLGTKTSLFSATIMEEREMLGQPYASTANLFGDGK